MDEIYLEALLNNLKASKEKLAYLKIQKNYSLTSLCILLFIETAVARKVKDLNKHIQFINDEIDSQLALIELPKDLLCQK